MKKIVFYYPSRNIGGAQMLFIRMANYFSISSNYEVYVIDYSDGYLRKNIRFNVNFIDFVDRKNIDMKDSVVVCPLSMIISIHNDLHSVKAKFLFWCLHPENAIDILKGSYRLRKFGFIKDLIVKCFNINDYLIIRNKISQALNKKEIFFIDKINLNRTTTFYYLNNTYKNLFLPIPIDCSGKKSLKINKNNLAWIGRLSSDKIYSLLHVLRKIEYVVQEKINFYIIGDGDCSKLIKVENYNKIKIIQKGSLPNHQLQDFLIDEQIGLVFAMGTSALESSVLSIPTIIIDGSYTPLPDDYRTRWVFEVKDYILGNLGLESNCGHDIVKLFSDFLLDCHNTIGQKCFDYVVQNHSIEKTAAILESYFEN